MPLPAPTRASTAGQQANWAAWEKSKNKQRVWIAWEITLKVWLMGTAMASRSQGGFGALWQASCPPKNLMGGPPRREKTKQWERWWFAFPAAHWFRWCRAVALRWGVGAFLVAPAERGPRNQGRGSALSCGVCRAVLSVLPLPRSCEESLHLGSEI